MEYAECVQQAIVKILKFRVTSMDLIELIENEKPVFKEEN